MDLRQEIARCAARLDVPIDPGSHLDDGLADSNAAPFNDSPRKRIGREALLRILRLLNSGLDADAAYFLGMLADALDETVETRQTKRLQAVLEKIVADEQGDWRQRL